MAPSVYIFFFFTPIHFAASSAWLMVCPSVEGESLPISAVSVYESFRRLFDSWECSDCPLLWYPPPPTVPEWTTCIYPDSRTSTRAGRSGAETVRRASHSPHFLTVVPAGDSPSIKRGEHTTGERGVFPGNV